SWTTARGRFAESGGGVEKFVTFDFGGDSGPTVLRRLGTDNLPVATDVDVAGASDLLGKRNYKLDLCTDLGVGIGKEVQTAVADIAGEGFELARARIERKDSHRQRHVEAASFAAIGDGHTTPSAAG